MSQWDVFRRGTLAGGSPIWRIRILNLCILLFVNSFFDSLSRPRWGGLLYSPCSIFRLLSSRTRSRSAFK